MIKNEIYFSSQQVKDSYINNIKRLFNWRKLTIKAINKTGLEYATIDKAIAGIYKGGSEPSYKVLVYCKKSQAVKLAEELKKVFNQDSILIDSNNKTLFI